MGHGDGSSKKFATKATTSANMDRGPRSRFAFVPKKQRNFAVRIRVVIAPVARVGRVADSAAAGDRDQRAHCR
jgi:hypothetical protein